MQSRQEALPGFFRKKYYGTTSMTPLLIDQFFTNPKATKNLFGCDILSDCQAMYAFLQQEELNQEVLELKPEPESVLEKVKASFRSLLAAIDAHTLKYNTGNLLEKIAEFEEVMRTVPNPQLTAVKKENVRMFFENTPGSGMVKMLRAITHPKFSILLFTEAVENIVGAEPLPEYKPVFSDSSLQLLFVELSTKTTTDIRNYIKNTPQNMVLSTF